MQRERDYRLCLSTDTDTSPLLLGQLQQAQLRIRVSLNAVLSYLCVLLQVICGSQQRGT